MILFLTMGLFSLLGLAATLRALRSAPDGYQDGLGYHVGEQPVELNRTERGMR